jgi:hypothetical protein
MRLLDNQWCVIVLEAQYSPKTFYPKNPTKKKSQYLKSSGT